MRETAAKNAATEQNDPKTDQNMPVHLVKLYWHWWHLHSNVFVMTQYLNIAMDNKLLPDLKQQSISRPTHRYPHYIIMTGRNSFNRSKLFFLLSRCVYRYKMESLHTKGASRPPGQRGATHSARAERRSALHAMAKGSSGCSERWAPSSELGRGCSRATTHWHVGVGSEHGQRAPNKRWRKISSWEGWNSVMRRVIPLFLPKRQNIFSAWGGRDWGSLELWLVTLCIALFRLSWQNSLLWAALEKLGRKQWHEATRQCHYFNSLFILHMDYELYGWNKTVFLLPPLQVTLTEQNFTLNKRKSTEELTAFRQSA